MHSGVSSGPVLASEAHLEHSFAVVHCKMEGLKVVDDARHMLEPHSQDVRREDRMVGSTKEGREFGRRKARRYFARKEVEAAVLDPFYVSGVSGVSCVSCVSESQQRCICKLEGLLQNLLENLLEKKVMFVYRLSTIGSEGQLAGALKPSCYTVLVVLMPNNAPLSRCESG
jgi:hypothetical protein